MRRLLRSGAWRILSHEVYNGEKVMPIQFQPMAAEEVAAIFGRRPRGPENVEDYIELLEQQKVVIGSGFSLKTQVVTPEEGDSYTILEGSVDETDPAGVTVRAAKRRFNMAAKDLGFELNWRETTGWLVAKAVEITVDNNSDGKTE
jgi:hypothetical protein